MITLNYKGVDGKMGAPDHVRLYPVATSAVLLQEGNWIEPGAVGHLSGPQIQVWARVPAAIADVKVGIVRDIHYTDTFTYHDLSQRMCETPDYLPDTIYPNSAGLESSEAGGWRTYKANPDHPGWRIGGDELRDIKEMKEVFDARNFVFVQFGSGEWYYAGQVDWKFTAILTGVWSSGSKYYWRHVKDIDSSPKPGLINKGKELTAEAKDVHTRTGREGWYAENPDSWTISKDGVMVRKWMPKRKR